MAWNCAAHAQEAREVQLQEVQVQAAKVIDRADGRLILPSEAQKSSSTNGYSLLGKLSLPGIRVDEVMHTVSALGNQGAVQLRINGVLATKEDLLALDPQLIRSVEFIDHPGVRYGTDIASVINIRMQRSDQGYTLGADLTNSLTAWHGDNTVFAKLTHKNSELELAYTSSYRDFRRTRYHEEADYLLADGTHYYITRQDRRTRSCDFGNAVQLKYSLADSSTYVFQATLSGDMSHTPNDYKERQIQDGTADYLSLITNRSKSFTPSLDLYYSRQIGARQSVTVNVVGTHIATDARNANDEGSAYAYRVAGRTWSLISEAVYENRLKPFTLSAGLRHRLKYTRNAYDGSAESLNGMHNASLYLFGEVKGKAGKWSYVAGLGMSSERYRQSSYRYDYRLFRPKGTLAYSISAPLTVRYSIEFYQHLSEIALISDTEIRQNSMEWTVGNPSLRPNGVTKQQLRVAYIKPRLRLLIDAEYRVNSHCNLAHYKLTPANRFLYKHVNQPGDDILYVRDNARYELIPEKLTLSAFGSIYRFFNRGDDYRHYLTSYNAGGSLQAYLGRWTLTAYADNGWKFMEGETWNRQGYACYVTCSYRMGSCTVSLYWQHPFHANPRLNHTEVVNENLKKKIFVTGKDYGNLITLGFSWMLNRGRKAFDVQKKLENKDKQTGIM